MSWTRGSETIGSRIFLAYSTPAPDDFLCQQLANHIVAGHQTFLAPALVPAYTLSSVKITDLSSKSGGIGFSTSTSAGTGTDTPLPIDVCAVLNHHIRRQYRGGRPRTYVPGGGNSVVLNGNVWDPAFITAMSDAWNGFIGFIKGTIGTLTITNHVNIPYFKGFTAGRDPHTNRPEDKPNLNPSIVPDVITSSTCRQILGSQRRRLVVG